MNTSNDFWKSVCDAIKGRPGSSEAVRLFQMRESFKTVFPAIEEETDSNIKQGDENYVGSKNSS